MRILSSGKKKIRDLKEIPQTKVYELGVAYNISDICELEGWYNKLE